MPSNLATAGKLIALGTVVLGLAWFAADLDGDTTLSEASNLARLSDTGARRGLTDEASQNWGDHIEARLSADSMAPQQEDTAFSEGNDSGAANGRRGLVRDPNDRSSWRDDIDLASYDAGAEMDPNDPQTWVDTFDSENHDPGPVLDPNDPSSWTDSFEVNSHRQGEFMDPNAPSTWVDDYTTDLRSAGPRLDPDDPSTWSESR